MYLKNTTKNPAKSGVFLFRIVHLNDLSALVGKVPMFFPRSKTKYTAIMKIINTRIKRTIAIPSPQSFRRKVPLGGNASLVVKARGELSRIVQGEDKRLAVMVGPCSIHSKEGALEFSKFLRENLHRWPHLLIMMRACFEKPRSVIEGPHHWRGLATDPIGDGSCDVRSGIELSREIGVGILSMGIPIVAECLRPEVFNCVADLNSCAWIGARNSGHQGHWEVGSGLSMPVGVKHDNNGGGVGNLANAMTSIAQPLIFTAQGGDAKSVVYETTGNRDTFGILRGTSAGPNYSTFHTEGLHTLLSKKGLSGAVGVDLSHGNATRPDGKKDHRLQMISGCDVAAQIEAGASYIRVVMIEASMKEGKHSTHPKRIADADPHQSITDPCLGLTDTLALLNLLEAAVNFRF